MYLQATSGSLQLPIARNQDFSNLAHKLVFKDSPSKASFIMQNIYVSWFLVSQSNNLNDTACQNNFCVGIFLIYDHIGCSWRSLEIRSKVESKEH